MFLDLLRKLKQRNVFRVTGFYAVTGYAVFQIANNLLPALNLPRWMVSLVAVLFLLGFPIVIITAYAFERTEAGVRRTTGTRLTAGSRLGWFDWSLLGAIVLAIGFAVFSVAVHRPAGKPLVAAAPAADARVAMPAKSIAVLPFVNFSSAADDDSFADGLTEELINGLAQLRDLQVAGRTSSFYFKGRNEDLRDIGRKLGVAHVLEGSVRRSGTNLRITAQLIKVEDGFHLWSQTFDRPWSDAFEIQTEISAAVAKVLQARLLGVGTANAPVAPRDPRAYQLELVALAHLRKQELPDLQAARDLYRQLLDQDPDNARAQAGYAEATITLAQNHLALDFDEAQAESKVAIDRALELDPQSADAWRVKGYFHRILAIRSGENTNNEIALVAFQRAVQLDPRNSEALLMLANQVKVSDPQQAVALVQRALQIDPLSRIGQLLLGVISYSRGKLADAQRQFETLLMLYPDYTNVRIELGKLLMEQGRLDDAVGVFDDEKFMRADPEGTLLLANCYANLGMQEEMTALLQSVREPPVAAALAQAALLQRAGKREEFARLAAQQLASTRDPIWRSVLMQDAVMSDRRDRLRTLVAAASPELLRDPPDTEQLSSIDAILFASALLTTGAAEQSARVARGVLRRNSAGPGEYDDNGSRLMRAFAQGLLGNVDAAIGEFQRAEAQGYRTLVDLDYFARPDEYPFMAKVTQDPRFHALVRKIDADTQRMRTGLRARRNEAAR